MAMALLITSTLRIFEIYSLISNRVADSWITPRYGGNEKHFRGRLNPVGKPSCRIPTGKRNRDYPFSKSRILDCSVILRLSKSIAVEARETT